MPSCFLATNQPVAHRISHSVVRNFLSSLNPPSTLLPYFREVFCEASQTMFNVQSRLPHRGCKEIFEGKELQHETVEVP
jgi:hypothetical protein